jgi:hypothetical protein
MFIKIASNNEKRMDFFVDCKKEKERRKKKRERMDFVQTSKLES